MNRDLHKIIYFVVVKREKSMLIHIKVTRSIISGKKINFKRWKNMTRVIVVVEDFVVVSTKSGFNLWK